MTDKIYRTFILLCIVFTMQGAIAGRTAPLVDKSYQFNGTTPNSAEQVRGFILAGAARYRSELVYKVESDTPGALQLEFNKDNEYYVSVLFNYDATGFKTQYVSSKNLNYSEANGARVIHPNYMVWLDEMFKQMKIASVLQLNEKGEATNAQVVAVLSFRVSGGATPVTFDWTDDTKDCNDFERVGTVQELTAEQIEARKKAIADWNEKYKDTKIFGKTFLQPAFVEPKTTLSLYTQAGVAVQIRGRAFSSTGNSTYSCGPLVEKFTPEGGKRYTIDFSLLPSVGTYGKCGQQIFDDTDPELRIPLPSEEIKECKKKGWFK